MQKIGQDKKKEIDFFDNFAVEKGDYDVFSKKSNLKLMEMCIKFGKIKPKSIVLDIGCGTGTFTKIMDDFGFRCSGLDISPNLIKIAEKKYPHIYFKIGDAENLPFESDSFDAVLLSGIIHHLPDPSKCAKEVFRILKPGGVFIAFDPNRKNPFMWIYRDRSSPFYSSKGVTKNERPVLAKEIGRIFKKEGFDISFLYLSGLEYKHVESGIAKKVLPAYNFIDRLMFNPRFMRHYRPFLLTKGIKPNN